jgi:DNA-binding transcriptional regulator YhcF (GntR family)
MSIGWYELNKEEQAKIIEGWREKGFGKPSTTKFTPTNELIIKVITKQPIQITEKEYEDDCNVVTSEDYDDWIYRALFDIQNGRIRAGEKTEKIEHPHDRLHRIGKESVDVGKSSSFYELIKKQLADGLKLPSISKRAMKTAQRRLTIANTYVEFISGFANTPKRCNLRVAKKEFKRQRQEQLKPDLPDVIDDALKEHGLDWSAYSPESPRKYKRKKR